MRWGPCGVEHADNVQTSSHRTKADGRRGGQFLKERVAHFPHYAGDIETFLLNIKISHCKRVFGKELVLQRCITSEDIEQGFKRFLIQKQEDNVRSREEEERLCAMYS